MSAAKRSTKGADLLATETAYLKKNLDALSRQYPGKYLLIKRERVHGAFETHDLGVDAGIRLFGRGPFLVRSVSDPDPDPVTIPALVVGVPLVADYQHPDQSQRKRQERRASYCP